MDFNEICMLILKCTIFSRLKENLATPKGQKSQSKISKDWKDYLFGKKTLNVINYGYF